MEHFKLHTLIQTPPTTFVLGVIADNPQAGKQRQTHTKHKKPPKKESWTSERTKSQIQESREQTYLEGQLVAYEQDQH